MPPAYVKPHGKRGETDAADAEAICGAVTRPTMRFVAIKFEDQQAVLMMRGEPRRRQAVVRTVVWRLSHGMCFAEMPDERESSG